MYYSYYNIFSHKDMDYLSLLIDAHLMIWLSPLHILKMYIFTFLLE